MYPSLTLLASLSLALSTTYAQVTSGVTIVSPPPGSEPPVLINTTTGNETVVEICPPPPTVFFNVTEHVPITEYATTTVTAITTATYIGTTTVTAVTTATYIGTTTKPITIFQTIISTTVLTATVTETETETETDTSTTTTTTVSISPTTATVRTTETDTTSTTATATEIISEFLTTERVTSITLCPTRTANPTYTANEPYPTDWTWGCPPGWLCKPLQQACNFEAGIPDQNFYCSPNECIPADVLPGYLPTWDADIYGNATPATDPGLTIQAIDHFFNMDPTKFGLTYEIFVVNEVFTRTSTYLEQPTPVVAARQAQTSVPGACYPWCNNCMLEAQSSGKSPKLCLPGSAFETSLSQCEQCISVHRGDDTGFVQIAPQFQQFLDYCDQFATVVVTTSETITTSTGPGTTATSIALSAISTTVTPIASASTSTSYGPGTTSATVVATTDTNIPTTVPTIISSSVSTILVSSGSATTTETVPATTSWSQMTIAPTEWPQITIIMPVGVNSTTTVYGSTLPTGGATLVLPVAISSSAGSLVSTPTGTASSILVSTPAGVSGSGSGGSGTASANPATFTGAAVALKFGSGKWAWRTLLLDLLIPFVLALVF
ncbi:hypothetical protein H2202_006364 [Exophiala xenobiotica]|nr:hypothetical protein H2202_006364 [Exophiala xenobiotica]KAK5204547.1 hypothetical protein LTR41_009719 [Exophiala xenobiotica]KAK5404997.1 hypothetical protein LTR06_009264 [Exophiala xenobiotica]